MSLRARAAQDSDADYALFLRFHGEFDLTEPPPGRAWWATNHLHAYFVYDDAESGEPTPSIGYGLAYWLEEQAYVLHVASAPEARRKGVGRFILRTLADHLRSQRPQGIWTLLVFQENVAAIRLYESIGMSIAHSTHVWEIAWTDVEAISGEAEALTIGALAPEDDDSFEAALSIARGRLAKSRANPQRLTLAARRGDTPVGLASFDAHFPGMPLFRAKEPGVARALLQAHAVNRPADQRRLRMVVENDEALGAALKAAGAALTESLHDMRGALPREGEI